jgi:hypothetical protein
MMSQLETVTLILVLYGAQIEVPDACGQWNEPFTHLRFGNDIWMAGERIPRHQIKMI